MTFKQWIIIINLLLLISEIGYTSDLSFSWRLIAKSPLILRGVMTVPTEEFNESRQYNEFKFINLQLKVIEVLKGNLAESNIQIKYQAKGRSDAPNPDFILSMNQKDAIFFLEYNDWPNWKGIYFTNHPPSEALQKFTKQLIQEIKREITKQERMIKDLKICKSETLPYQNDVKLLIKEMFVKESAAMAYNKLSLLDSNAVPALVCNLDNRQQLPLQTLIFSKMPGFTIQYHPKVAIDALAAILNKITEENFGRIYNGGSERERDQLLWSWRVWLGYYESLKDKGQSP